VETKHRQLPIGSLGNSDHPHLLIWTQVGEEMGPKVGQGSLQGPDFPHPISVELAAILLPSPPHPGGMEQRRDPLVSTSP
jgi:hypothetical protein